MWGCFLMSGVKKKKKKNVWSENTALFERLMEIHSNSPKLYYGFKPWSQISPPSPKSRKFYTRNMWREYV